jgi:hypothetical protein
MPNREQIDSVVAVIERLQSEVIGGKPWAELTHGEKYVVLREIEWTGFAPKEEAVVIGRILANEPSELWMEGMDRRESHRGRSPAKPAIADTWRQEVAAGVDARGRDGLFSSE